MKLYHTKLILYCGAHNCLIVFNTLGAFLWVLLMTRFITSGTFAFPVRHINNQKYNHYSHYNSHQNILTYVLMAVVMGIMFIFLVINMADRKRKCTACDEPGHQKNSKKYPKYIKDDQAIMCPTCTILNWYYTILNWYYTWYYTILNWYYIILNRYYTILNWYYTILNWYYIILNWYYTILNWYYTILNWY